MDLGTYERYLHTNITKNNYLTGGKLFSKILNQERQGSYLGRDVQFIPHVTAEIKRFVRQLAVSSDADVVFVEVGGTVGDIENNYFLEAMRELKYEEGAGNVAVVAVTYVLHPHFLGEQKSKAAQLGLKTLMGLGLQPDIIACRCEQPVTSKSREKISVSSNVPIERVVSVHDCDSIYIIPALLQEAKLDEQTISLLGLQPRLREDIVIKKQWQEYVHKINSAQREITIGITGKYTALRDSYASIIKALEHAGTHLGAKVHLKWIDTTDLKEDTVAAALTGVDGIIVPGAFGSRGAEGKINCINYVREHKIPYLGLCFGFQMALVEYARNKCKLTGAHTTEIDPNTIHPVIDLLPEQTGIGSLGGNMRLGGHDVDIKVGTMAAQLYGSLLVRERFRHRWECNPDYIKTFEENGIIFSGKAPGRDIMQILELPKDVHPYFVATQYHGEYLSRPLDPHPLYMGLLKAAMERKK
ncbi:MAG: CTP synthase (glutamine hydrolyzing), partial [Nanoarchaeota archaeon]|nr:CTP synthase (glutamine hydrolyzing) [Nanoarchaeota archaeon]